MSLGERLRALRAMWSMLKRAALSGQLFKPHCELTPPHPDILCEYNVKIPIADGIVLTANVFRSRKAQEEGVRVPVVMCAHPYNNQLIPALGTTPFGGAPVQYRVIPQVGRPRFSTLTSWESPDPNFWVPAGYAVVNLNLPGYGTSGGPPTVFSDHQAKSYYEAIEWIARQSWCSGKVGLNGISFLAITPVLCRRLSTLRRPAAVVAVHLPMGRAFRHVPRPGLRGRNRGPRVQPVLVGARSEAVAQRVRGRLHRAQRQPADGLPEAAPVLR